MAMAGDKKQKKMIDHDNNDGGHIPKKSKHSSLEGGGKRKRSSTSNSTVMKSQMLAMRQIHLGGIHNFDSPLGILSESESRGSSDSGDNDKWGWGRTDGPAKKNEAPTPAIESRIRANHHPRVGIMEPGPNDCLFGRGGGTNRHPGNKRYRKMVEDKKDKYLKTKFLDKSLVAMEIINEWRALDPPGRFLKQNDATKHWDDVGDKKASEKTSQALREKTRTKQCREGERTIDDGDVSSSEKPNATASSGKARRRTRNWTGEEDVRLAELAGTGIAWNVLARDMENHNAKQCRERVSGREMRGLVVFSICRRSFALAHRVSLSLMHQKCRLSLSPSLHTPRTVRQPPEARQEEWTMDGKGGRPRIVPAVVVGESLEQNRIGAAR